MGEIEIVFVFCLLWEERMGVSTLFMICSYECVSRVRGYADDLWWVLVKITYFYVVAESLTNELGIEHGLIWSRITTLFSNFSTTKIRSYNLKKFFCFSYSSFCICST